jgi:hypothetical protein
MFYKKVKDDQGVYADAAGVRYDICAARRIRKAAGCCCDKYEWFPSLSGALLAWGGAPCAEQPQSMSQLENQG